MSKFISLDQSLSKFAWIVWNEGEIESYGVWRTGNVGVKTKRKDVTYFEHTEEQIDMLCDELVDLFDQGYPEVIVMEGLSFGSAGNATRDLAGLYYGVRRCLMSMRQYGYSNWIQYAPTSLKSFARDYLEEEKQTETSAKTGKPIKAKMDKKLMVEAARNQEGKDFLSKYNYSTGLDDLADAYWAGRKYLEENQ